MAGVLIRWFEDTNMHERLCEETERRQTLQAKERGIKRNNSAKL